MSKLKRDIIQKIYKDNYHCQKGHNIIWQGKSYIFSNNLSCDKCGKSSKLQNPIRWSCSQCNIYFCSKCYDLIIDKNCPIKHRYKFVKQNMIEFSPTYTCDKCRKTFNHKDGVLFDKECNITICPICFCNSCDIPDVLED